MHKFRRMATSEFNGLGDKVSQAFAQWFGDEGRRVWMTCGNCRHSQRQGPMFCHEYKMVPPLEIILDATKCEGYSDEAEIPF